MSGISPDPRVFNKLRGLVLREPIELQRAGSGVLKLWGRAGWDPPLHSYCPVGTFADPVRYAGKTPEELNIRIVEDYAFESLLATPAVNQPVWRHAVESVLGQPDLFSGYARLSSQVDSALSTSLTKMISTLPTHGAIILDYFTSVPEEYPFMGGLEVREVDGPSIHFPATGVCVIKDDENGKPLSDDYIVALTVAYMSFMQHGAMAQEIFVVSRRHHEFNCRQPPVPSTSDHFRLSYIRLPAEYLADLIKQLRRPVETRTLPAEKLVCYRSRWIQWFQSVNTEYPLPGMPEPEPNEALKEERRTWLKLLAGMGEHILSGEADVPGLVTYLAARKGEAFVPMARSAARKGSESP